MTVSVAARLEPIDGCRWRLPRGSRPGMHVPGIVYADAAMAAELEHDPALDQVANVATLPGIVRASLAMPDIHWGYGFAIGGVAAFRLSDGVVAAGGVGYDINCGTRIIRTTLTRSDLEAVTDRLADELAQRVPAGLASQGPTARAGSELDAILRGGARWAVEHGLGWPDDLETCEERGAMDGADPGLVSARAKERGRGQLGSLGSGNHFVEVEAVDEVFDDRVAAAFGVSTGQIVVFLHTGSRGLGHQVCTDFLGVMGDAARRSGIQLPDRQLACAYIRSKEGQEYLAAMRAAANFAWANRQAITHAVRGAFTAVFRRSADALGMSVLYDVAHNIAKVERHADDGESVEVLVHRKGATRAFPAHHPDVPARYAAAGQPVLIPGDMGRYSFLCVGADGAMRETFGSTCHGAGRRQSRHAALREQRGVDLVSLLRAKGITVRVTDRRLLGEEASSAYKDVASVVEVCDRAGIARKVARLRPIIVVKG
ncbi:MAG: RtcB family protein [Chloroflexi bacterium]|nr:RtcB family protein [Chloroflexota bacterium]